jgi:hypothetical protein
MRWPYFSDYLIIGEACGVRKLACALQHKRLFSSHLKAARKLRLLAALQIKKPSNNEA